MESSETSDAGEAGSSAPADASYAAESWRSAEGAGGAQVSEAEPRELAAELLPHLDWLARLAGRTTRDPHAAEDLTQDVLLAALQKPPSERQRLQAWLRAVLLNRSRESRRKEGRRRERERAVALAAEDPDADPAEHLAELTEAARLRSLLGELRAPYAQILALRFLDGLEPREIAARCGLPLATVHTQIGRGTKLLRERLEAQPKRRAGWRGWWVALARKKRSAQAEPAGAAPLALDSLRGFAPAFAALALAALCAAVWMARRPPQEAPTAQVARAAGALEPAVAEGELAPEARSAVTAPAPLRRIAGRVVDAAGVPQAGVPVTFLAEGAPGARAVAVQSGAGGAFELELAEDSAGRLRAGSERGRPAAWVALRDAPIEAAGRAQPSAAPELVVAARWSVAGRAVDARGAPVYGFRVRYEIPDRRDPALAPPALASFTAESDLYGRFHLAGVGWGPGAELTVEHPAHRPAVVACTAPFERRLEIHLEPLLGAGAHEDVLRGRVVDALGRGLAGAAVACAAHTTRTEADGSFAVLAPDGARASAASGARASAAGGAHASAASGARSSAPSPALHVAAEGYRPARFEVGAERSDLELALELPALAVAGRVVDAGGAPLEGASVWLADPTPFGSGERAWFAESVAAPAPEPGEEWGAWPLGLAAETDADGRFRLDGLDLRAYEIRAAAPGSLAFASARVDLAAGPPEDVELRLPAGSGARVAGRVLDARGAPCAGWRVATWSFATDVALVDGRRFSPRIAGPAAHTDAAGRFDLGAVPGDAQFLALEAPGRAAAWFDLQSRADLAVLELRPEGPFRARVMPPAGAEHEPGLLRFEFLRAGRAVRLFPRGLDEAPDRWLSSFSEPLVGSCSEVLMLHERPDRVRLWRAQKLAGELDVALRAGEVELFQF